VGLNYFDHARESGMETPRELVLFIKAPNTVVGPYDNILIPRRSTKTDLEVELGVLIGREGRHLGTNEEARSCIAGYCISHDVSEREFQLERSGQWTKGESCDTFNPLGPFLATLDEVHDPGNLQMMLSVNGQIRQNATTAFMIFPPAELVRYISHFMTLEPGDLIRAALPPESGSGWKCQLI
jgi:2,4-didehydro-3-deoxy-L-rhamnonate hydrolase